MKIEIIVYRTETGQEPFVSFLKSLDFEAQNRINKRMIRVSEGNFGDYKNLGGNIFELRFTIGGGLRIYFGGNEKTIILLLCGGNKKTQKRDVEKAKQYWGDYVQKTQKQTQQRTKLQKIR